MTDKEQLLSIQRALLGSVRSDLRVVILDFSEANTYSVQFVLDHEPSDDDIDFYSAAATEFCSDISFRDDTKYREEVVYSNSSFKDMISEKQRFVYCRFE